MPTPPLSEEAKREALEALEAAGGNVSQAARELGLNRNTFKSRLEQARQDPAIQNAMSDIGTGMVPSLVWAKTKNKGGVSHSVLLKPQALPDDTLDRIKAAFETMQPAVPVPPPAETMADLLTVYPLFDVHFGMHAWGVETRNYDYDLDHARADLKMAFGNLIALTPPAEQAVLLIGGDFFHADDNRAETPKNKHRLDVCHRFDKVIDEGIEVVISLVQTLLEKHQTLSVWVLRGNHDENAHRVLRQGMRQRYREDERVSVGDTSDFYWQKWGRTMVSAHHGDDMTPRQIKDYLSDVVPFWSDTYHRYCFTGHVHNDRAQDIGGLRWESLRAFTPPDAYGASGRFVSRRTLQTISFSKVSGMKQRNYDPIEREPA